MKLKVCGLKYKDNILELAEFRPDYMGFIFYEKSKRFVGEDFEMPLLPESITKVGVFVNSETESIIEKVKSYGLGLVQLHGDETPEFCKTLAEELAAINGKSKVGIMKAFGVDESFDFECLKKYETTCSYFLFDTKTTDYGGSGKKFDWSLLSNNNFTLPYFLSGGLGLEEIENLDNQKLSAFAIDVNSKFEISPGRKDIEMIKKIKD